MPSHQPKPPAVPLPVWRGLLAAATEFRTAAPWTWLEDQDVFALIDEEGRPWFPSVLGAAGQVFGLALYRGENGLRFLLKTAPALGTPDCDPRELMFLQDALLLDWGSKRELAQEDLAVLAALDHRPPSRARQAWPSFRSHVPGWFPWFLDEAEALALTCGLRATLACAALARANPGFFRPCEADGSLLPTVSVAAALRGPLADGQVEWRQWQLSPPAAPAPIRLPTGWESIRKKSLNNRGVLEFDIFLAATPTSDGGRPYFPRLGLLADGQTGYIYAMQLAPPARPWEELVTAVWAQALLSLQQRPRRIAIRRLEWMAALAPLAAALDIELELRDELREIDSARAAMERDLGA